MKIGEKTPASTAQRVPEDRQRLQQPREEKVQERKPEPPPKPKDKVGNNLDVTA